MGIMGRQSAAMFVMVLALFFALGAFIGTFYKMDLSMIEWCKDIAKSLIGAGLIAIQIGGTRTNSNGNGASEVKNSKG
jgi:phage gp29-like protein